MPIAERGMARMLSQFHFLRALRPAPLPPASRGRPHRPRPLRGDDDGGPAQQRPLHPASGNFAVALVARAGKGDAAMMVRNSELEVGRRWPVSVRLNATERASINSAAARLGADASQVSRRGTIRLAAELHGLPSVASICLAPDQEDRR